MVDGDVIDGIASVDESAVTGESAPVIRESGGDRSGVTGGTRVISDRIIIRVTMEKGYGFLDHMIALVEGARRQKTPNEIALIIFLASASFCWSARPSGHSASMLGWFSRSSSCCASGVYKRKRNSNSRHRRDPLMRDG